MGAIKTFTLEWKFKKPKARFFMALGALFLLVALAAIVVPVIPQFPFAIAAAYFFSKGSMRIHFWIRHNKMFGMKMRDWEDHHVVRPKVKILSTIGMIGGAVFAFLKVAPPWNWVTAAIMAITIAFVLTRKSKPYRLLPL